jgi:hypothetical protein
LLKVSSDGTIDPVSDGGTNWTQLPTREEVDAKADQATTYTETEVDGLIATRTESPGETAITGTAAFTNATNNIALTGIGSIGLEIGDVVQVTGTASNDKLFTVEVITDSGNVIVNQAHAGGTTTKSLVDETVSATVTLVSKWFNAAAGLGQGWLRFPIPSKRSTDVVYTNSTNREIAIAVTRNVSVSSLAINVDDVEVMVAGTNENGRVSIGLDIPVGSTYEVTGDIGSSYSIWAELR